MTRQGGYPMELRERAVRMVFEHQDEHPSQWSAITSIATKFGVSKEALRKWVRRAEIDRGFRPGLTTDERERLKVLERENRELRRGQRDGDFQPVSGGFLRGGARPPTDQTITYVDEHKDRFGVEPICAHCRSPRLPTTGQAPAAVCPDAPRRGAEGRDRPGPQGQTSASNGAKKISRQLHREGIAVARCTVERLMVELGLEGARRGKKRRTTIPDETAPRPADLLDATSPPPGRTSSGSPISRTWPPGRASSTWPS